jgi:hypothetical protein
VTLEWARSRKPEYRTTERKLLGTAYLLVGIALFALGFRVAPLTVALYAVGLISIAAGAYMWGAAVEVDRRAHVSRAVVSILPAQVIWERNRR